MYKAGFENVVASSGTALTPDQIRLIKRFTKNITILYDGDQAGIMASFRGIDLILEQGMNVRIIMFPPDEDPDSFVSKHRTAETKEFLAQEKDFIRFKTGLLLDEAAGDPVKKAGLIREIVETISLIPDSIYRNVYIKECSSLLDTPEQILVNELNKIIRNKYKKEQQSRDQYVPEQQTEPIPQPRDVDHTNSEFQEREIIRLLLQYGQNEISFKKEVKDEEGNTHSESVSVNVGKYLVTAIKADDLGFNNAVYQMIFDEYHQMLSTKQGVDENDFINHEMEQVRSTCADLLSSPYELSENWEKKKIYVSHESSKLNSLIDKPLLSFKIKKVDARILQLQNKLKDVEEEDLFFLITEQKEQKNISLKFNKDLGRIITH